MRFWVMFEPRRLCSFESACFSWSADIGFVASLAMVTYVIFLL
jgi:hypothetical protein